MASRLCIRRRLDPHPLLSLRHVVLRIAGPRRFEGELCDWACLCSLLKYVMVFQRCAIRIRIILLRATWICGLPRVLSVVDMVGQLRALQSVGRIPDGVWSETKTVSIFLCRLYLGFWNRISRLLADVWH